MAGGASGGQEILFAAAGLTVLKSTDHGVTWNATGLGGGRAVACDASGQIVYAACWDTVYKSTDGGQTWTVTGLGLYRAFCIAIDPASPDTVYIGGQNPDPVLMKSTDGGATWQNIAASLSYQAVTHIEPIAAWPGSVLVCAENIFLSQDGGARWVQLGTLNDIDRITVHPTKPTILYAQSQSSGLWKSNNSGRTWKAIGLSKNVGVAGLLLDPAAPNTLYAVFGPSGLGRSKDGGKTWKLMFPGRVVNMMPTLISPTNHKSLYGYVQDSSLSALWFSANMGKTWTRTSLSASGVSCIGTDPAGGPTLYAGCWNGVFKSTNLGGSWTYAGLAGQGVRTIAVSPSSADTVYAGTFGNGCFKTADGGMTWSPIDPSPSMSSFWVRNILIVAGSPEKVYVSGSGGIFRTSDGGATWSTLPIGAISPYSNSDVLSFALDSGDPNLMLAGVSNLGVARSSDGGASWLLTPLRTGEAFLVAADPFEPGTFYAAGGGIYITTNGGLSWRYVGTPGGGIQSMVVDGSRPGRIFTGLCEGCGSGTSGAWESSDGGVTWSQLAERMATHDSGGLALSGSRLFGLVTPTSAYWEAYGSVLYTDTETDP
jgi:photosystem II stability/assembly factor-like uncharacterized protein